MVELSPTHSLTEDNSVFHEDCSFYEDSGFQRPTAHMVKMEMFQNEAPISCLPDMDSLNTNNTDQVTPQRTKEKALPSTEMDQSLLSWITKHPSNWSPTEVLDWLYFIAAKLEVNFDKFRGEAFQNVTGAHMCHMPEESFEQMLGPEYGKIFYSFFYELLEGVKFQKPTSYGGPSVDGLGPVPMVPGLSEQVSAMQGVTMDTNAYETNNAEITAMSKFLPFQNNSNMMNNGIMEIDGSCYDFELSKDLFPDLDPGYGSFSDYSDSDKESTRTNPPQDYPDVFQSSPYNLPTSVMHQTTGSVPTPTRRPGRPPKKPRCSVSSEDGSDAEYAPSQSNRGRRAGQSAKGNHLWEFIRDTLKNPMYCPKLIKWEDRKEGVFRFVQSEAVAAMWGRKKNNPGMTYEKLSRAMRFSRTAGYFADVPKDGKFPKKLCFKFGVKAYGWKDE